MWKNFLTDEDLDEETLDELAEEEMDEDLFDQLSYLPREILGIYFKSSMEPSPINGNSDQATPFSSSIFTCFSSVTGTMNWLPGYLSQIHNPYLKTIITFLDHMLRGFGQIFFCNNTLSGLVILIAIAVQSTRVAVHAIIAVFTATLTARLMGLELGLIASGLFSYNAGLIGKNKPHSFVYLLLLVIDAVLISTFLLYIRTMQGIAVATFDSAEKHTGYSLRVALLVALLCVLSVIFFVAISKLLLAYECPPMTLPFDFVVSAILLGSVSMTNLEFHSLAPPTLPEYSDEAPLYEMSFRTFLTVASRGVGQVVFASELIPCVLIIVALAICSWRTSLHAFLGASMGSAFAMLVGIDEEEVHLGIYGYSSALTFIATEMFFVPSVGEIY